MANKRFNQITRVVTSFDSNDVLPIGNGTLGDGKMASAKLLELTAQNVYEAKIYQLTQTNANFWVFDNLSIKTGDKIRIVINKTSGTSTHLVVYKNTTSASDVIKSAYIYGSTFEYVATEDITKITCYVAGMPSGTSVELSGSLTLLTKFNELSEEVDALQDNVDSLQEAANSSEKVTSVTYDIVGANLAQIEKTIDILPPMNQYGAIIVAPTPNPWPVDTVGGSNPLLFGVWWIDNENVEHAVVLKYGSLDGLASVVEVPFGATARKIRFWIRANTGSQIKIRIYPKIMTDNTYILGQIGNVSVPMAGANNTIVEKTINVSQPVRQYKRLRFVPSKIPWNVNNVIGSNALVFGVKCITEDGVEHQIRDFGKDSVFSGNREYFDCYVYPGTKAVKLRMRADSGESVTFSVSQDVSSGANSQLEFNDFLRASQNKLRRGVTLPQFAVVGDPHGVAKGMRTANSTFRELSDVLDFAIVLGDICSDYPNEANAYAGYNDMIDDAPVTVLPVIGNHDVGSWYYIGHYAPLATIVNNVMGPAITKGFIPSTSTGYYYKDFADKKLRVVVLNLYDNQGVYDASSNWERVVYDSTAPQIAMGTSYNAGDVVNVSPWTDYSYKAKVSLTTPASIPSQFSHDVPCFSTRPDGANIHQTQAQWLADTLLSTPAGFGVILVGHTSYSNKMSQVVESKFMAKLQTNAEMQSSFAVGIGDSNDIIADILDKFVNGQDATLTYTRGSETIEVDCEFSGKNEGVKHIGYIAGHLHYDAVTRHPTYTYQYAVHACASFIFNHKWTDLQFLDTASLAYTNYTLVAPSLSDGGSNLIKVGLKMTDDGYLRDCDRVSQ